MTTRTRGITIGQLAKAAGVNLETVRYYERIQLMPRTNRTEGGHRAYDSGHVRRLAFIRRARELGFGIENIRALLTAVSPATGHAPKSGILRASTSPRCEQSSPTLHGSKKSSPTRSAGAAATNHRSVRCSICSTPFHDVHQSKSSCKTKPVGLN